MNSLNYNFSSLTLHELQRYVFEIETENEQLRRDFTIASNIICILERLAKSCQNGYSLLRKIEINKSCDCNEHLNLALRKLLNNSVIESNVWLDQYEKFKTNQSAFGFSDEEDIDCSDGDDSYSNIAKITAKQQQADSVDQNAFNRCQVCTDLEDSSHNQSKSVHYICNDLSNCDPNNHIQHQTVKHSYNECLTKRDDLRLNEFNSKIEDIERRNKNQENDIKGVSNKLIQSQIISSDHRDDSTKNALPLVTRSKRPGPGRPPKNDRRYLNFLDKYSKCIESDDAYKRTRYSGVGRYKCPWPDCDYMPHFLRDLRRHMHKHTGEKRYKCNIDHCNFITVWKTSLLQHQRKKHITHANINLILRELNGVNGANGVNGVNDVNNVNHSINTVKN